MIEINRLRARLKNAHPKAIEFAMSMKEAKGLLKEIEDLIKEKDNRVIKEDPVIEDKTDINEPASITRIIDGGAF